MYTDDELGALTEEQRSDLARRLAVLQGAPIERTQRIERERHIFTTVVLVVTLFLIPWTILLAFTLPRHYVAARWGAVWVGFDIGLTAWLAVTAWAAWRRRHMLIFASLITATLLLVDVWFDVGTAAPRNDLLLSIATAVFGNIPLAVLLGVVAYRLIIVSARNARRLAGDAEVEVPLRKLPMYGVDEVPVDG
jgi:hypothetical protein